MEHGPGDNQRGVWLCVGERPARFYDSAHGDLIRLWIVTLCTCMSVCKQCVGKEWGRQGFCSVVSKNTKCTFIYLALKEFLKEPEKVFTAFSTPLPKVLCSYPLSYWWQKCGLLFNFFYWKKMDHMTWLFSFTLTAIIAQFLAAKGRCFQIKSSKNSLLATCPAPSSFQTNWVTIRWPQWSI